MGNEPMSLDELLESRPQTVFSSVWRKRFFDELSIHMSPDPLGEDSVDALVTATLNLYDAGCPILIAWENVLAVAFHVGFIGAMRVNRDLKEILKAAGQPTQEPSRRSQ